MELNLSEIDNMKSYQQNGENYWEKPKIQESQPKKKKVSFNDILSNMNLVVNKEGVLQFMSPTKELISDEQQYISENNNYNYNANQFNQKSNFNQQSNFNQEQKNNNSDPLDPLVKHSYIYNKYFKDYADPNVEKPMVRVPKTMEEYYQMLLDDKKRAIEHKLRIEQIKSKKLMFTVTPDSTGVNPRNIVPTKNNLRSMNFH
jgi:hypothetical protein